jgi:3-deoxy-manno-octulosonate cytidylyltransferase (CMP-KDO synthetase)
MNTILGIIPARLASTRFPNKVLYNIEGKTMLQRVYEQAKKANSLTKIIIATDHEDVVKHAKSFGAECIMTSADHPSGTDRCFEAMQKLNENFDYIINIQGDEPFIQPEQIDTLASVLERKTVELATLIKKIDDEATLTDPNEVKVTFNVEQEAIYFSRSIIPYIHQYPENEWLDKFTFYKHVGMYAYRNDVLMKITDLPTSYLENAESLEQLRWIENGFKIKVAITELESYCIDVPEDLEHPIFQKFLKNA